jgi:hypothetical protein
MKRSVSKTGLQGFKSWLEEHFPGRRLGVTFVKEGDDYICSLKLRGVLIAQGKAPTQKASAEKAAAQAHQVCKGEPALLRDLVRSREGMDAVIASTSTDVVAELPATTEGPEIKKLRKVVAEQGKQLDESIGKLQAQAKDLKRLKREMADLQNLNLSSKLGQLHQDVSGLRAALHEVAGPVLEKKLSQVYKSKDQNSQRLDALEKSVQTLLDEKDTNKLTASSACERREVTATQLTEAFHAWSPEFIPMKALVLATILTCRITVLPNLALGRACQQALDPHYDLAVFYVEPGWVSPSQCIQKALLEKIQSALEVPHCLHLLVYDGLQRAGLQTWARPLRQWAQGFASLAQFPDQAWPSNLRLCFIPAPHQLINTGTLPGLAAISPRVAFFQATFDRLDWGQFLQSPPVERKNEPDSTRCRLTELLGQLGRADQAHSWSTKILESWPKVYQQEGWWSTSPSAEHV